MKSFFGFFILSFLLMGSKVYAQNQETRTTYFPIWSFHDNNTDIYGLSLGLITTKAKIHNTNSYGIRLELIGLGILSPQLPHSLIAKDFKDFQSISSEPLSEKIYGLSVAATGTFCDCKVNGLSIGGFGQYNYQVNGLSVSPFVNMTQIHNGIQISLQNDSFQINGVQVAARNHSYITTGVQIGLYNFTKELFGFQIGIWNINQKRALPVINWAF